VTGLVDAGRAGAAASYRPRLQRRSLLGARPEARPAERFAAADYAALVFDYLCVLRISSMALTSRVDGLRSILVGALAHGALPSPTDGEHPVGPQPVRAGERELSCELI